MGLGVQPLTGPSDGITALFGTEYDTRLGCGTHAEVRLSITVQGGGRKLLLRQGAVAECATALTKDRPIVRDLVLLLLSYLYNRQLFRLEYFAPLGSGHRLERLLVEFLLRPDLVQR